MLDPSHTQFAEPFNLENGAEQLEARFSHLELRPYPGSLEVTEVGPLVDYLLTTADAGALSDERIERVTRILESELEAEGVVRISKETGLFIAVA
jgi:hypothetical protein